MKGFTSLVQVQVKTSLCCFLMSAKIKLSAHKDKERSASFMVSMETQHQDRVRINGGSNQAFCDEDPVSSSFAKLVIKEDFKCR